MCINKAIDEMFKKSKGKTNGILDDLIGILLLVDVRKICNNGL